MLLQKHILTVLSLFFVVICLLWLLVLWLLVQGQQQTLLTQSQAVLNNALHYRQQFSNILSLETPQQTRIINNILQDIRHNQTIQSITLFDKNRHLMHSSDENEATVLALDTYNAPIYSVGLITQQDDLLIYISPLQNDSQTMAYLKIRFKPWSSTTSIWTIGLISLGFFLLLSIIFIRIYEKMYTASKMPLSQLKQALSKVVVHDLYIEHPFLSNT